MMMLVMISDSSTKLRNMLSEWVLNTSLCYIQLQTQEKSTKFSIVK